MSNDISSMYTKDREPDVKVTVNGSMKKKTLSVQLIMVIIFLRKREVRRNVVNRVCCGAYYMAWFLHRRIYHALFNWCKHLRSD